MAPAGRCACRSCGDEDWRCCDVGLWAAATMVSTSEERTDGAVVTWLSRLLATSKLEQMRDGGQRGLLLLGGRRGRRLWPLSLVVVVVGLGLLWLSRVWRGRTAREWISARLCGSVVDGVLRLLERLALPHRAVDHAGQMHRHGERGEGDSHGSQQRLRNRRAEGRWWDGEW